MESGMLLKAKLVFEGYNKTVEGVYEQFYNEDYLKKTVEEDLEKDIEEDSEFSRLLKAALDEWENTSLSELDGASPAVFFTGIDSFENTIEVFKLGSKIVEDRLPGLLIKKLDGFGDTVVDVLLGLSTDEGLYKSQEEDFFISLFSIRALGMLKAERAALPLIELLRGLKEEEELIADAVAVALEDIGEKSLAPLIDSLEAMEEFGFGGEFLAGSLLSIGMRNKSDSVYRALKNVFLRIEDKCFGAEMLADYGDSRAIPSLRGYAVKNLQTIESEVFYTIKHAVERLGGNMEDIDFRR